MTQSEETKKALESAIDRLKAWSNDPELDLNSDDVLTLLEHYDRAALSQSPQGDAVSKEARLYEDALQYLYDFTGSKPIGSTEYQIHMYIYSIFQSAEKGEFND